MISWIPGQSLHDIERAIIEKAIGFYGNEERAAHSLKISMKDLKKKLNAYKEEEERIIEARLRAKEEHERFVLRSRGKGGVPA